MVGIKLYTKFVKCTFSEVANRHFKGFARFKHKNRVKMRLFSIRKGGQFMDFDDKKKEINIGSGESEAIIINKLYGPTDFDSLRITADCKNYKWIIEREIVKEDEHGNYLGTEWEKVSEIEALKENEGE